VSENGEPAPVSPAVAHETKVDHAEIIIEVSDRRESNGASEADLFLPQLFTKAYEFFKAHKTKNMTFFVASQIALAHYEGGNYEMALK
jgi:trafficking protein particle complex subunit 11